MIIMSVDFGDSRTGLAVCGKSELMASPAGVIVEKDFEKCIEKTASAAQEHRAELIVVGYPKNMNNTI
ncbi:MAG: RuvX/YqgF family protein, partial [Ruminococcus sp.]|nr:RuvX/YqgF family protein [Ruminococcus sp.]